MSRLVGVGISKWFLSIIAVGILVASLLPIHTGLVKAETDIPVMPDSILEPLSMTDHVVNIQLFGSASKGWGLSAENMSSPGPTITAKEGDLINMTLTSVDGNLYNFFVDYNGNGLADSGEPTSPDFNSTVYYSFNVTHYTIGDFTYRCKYRYLQYPEDTMTGRFITEPWSIVEDPIPEYFETDEYLIGSVAVAVIFPESNGSKEPDTEDWTDQEIEQALAAIQHALTWWANQNPDANVSFVTEVHTRVPTGYEPITPSILDDWIRDVLSYLGFPRYAGPRPAGPWFPYHNEYDYLNALRVKYGTDWAFLIFVLDASNTADGLLPGINRPGCAAPGHYIEVAFKNPTGFDNLVAHEVGHIFWASDEYYYDLPPMYNGYLNVPCIPHSGCLMDSWGSWNLTGKPHGLNGTWGQVGWRDSNGNGVQDIVDTPQVVYLDPYTIVGNRLSLTGTSEVVPFENKIPHFVDHFRGLNLTRRNVTINSVQSVQFRIDGGTWFNASFDPTTVRKLVKYPATYADKQTYARVNFTLLTPELTPGNHLIEVKATNQWGISGYVNTTVEVKPFLSTDLNQDGMVNILDITIVAAAYNTRLGDEKWNELADLDKNGIVNILDVTMVAKDYGKTV